ncbi:TonB family protein [Flavobacterium sp. UBA6135]|uniref:TonB family protein n=1 Tax=Flavobacterium sp. UBA6135 TaxID=1946553 RepID=UPI0025C314D7|nr:TonB family protein [Flavobacterium sp. UBA6135]
MAMLLTGFNPSFGQISPKKEIAFNFDYSFDVDTASGFCLFSLKRYSNDFEYPKTALLNNIQGSVLVSFNVSEKCSVTNIKVVKGLGYGLDEIAIVTALGKDIMEKRVDCCKFNFTVPVVFRIVEG